MSSARVMTWEYQAGKSSSCGEGNRGRPASATQHDPRKHRGVGTDLPHGQRQAGLFARDTHRGRCRAEGREHTREQTSRREVENGCFLCDVTAALTAAFLGFAAFLPVAFPHSVEKRSCCCMDPHPYTHTVTHSPHLHTRKPSISVTRRGPQPPPPPAAHHFAFSAPKNGRKCVKDVETRRETQRRPQLKARRRDSGSQCFL